MPLTRTQGLRRSGRLRQQSRKRRKTMPARARCVREVMARAGGRCEWQFCDQAATDVHEILSRARGGSPLDPANALAVCRWHHDFCHANPKLAASVGWMLSQFKGRRNSKGDGHAADGT